MKTETTEITDTKAILARISRLMGVEVAVDDIFAMVIHDEATHTAQALMFCHADLAAAAELDADGCWEEFGRDLDKMAELLTAMDIECFAEFR